MTPDPAAPAPLPVGTSEQAAEISAARIALLMILADGTSVIGTPGDHAAIDRLLRAQHAATLAHLAAQAPDGVEELVYRLTDAVADVVDNPAGPYRIAAQVRRDEAKSALLAAFTALRGEVDHWKAEATVREERSEMWRNQFNNLRAATAANADHWDATEAALRQSLDAAVERAEAAEGLLGDVLLSNDIGKSHLDSEIPDWAVRVRRFLAPRGASDGSGPADREGR